MAHPVNTNEDVTLIVMLNMCVCTVITTSVSLKMIKHFVYVRPRNEIGKYRVSGSIRMQSQNAAYCYIHSAV